MLWVMTDQKKCFFCGQFSHRWSQGIHDILYLEIPSGILFMASFNLVVSEKKTVAGIPKENLLGNHPGVWLLMQSCRVFGDLGEATWTFCEFVGGF